MPNEQKLVPGENFHSLQAKFRKKSKKFIKNSPKSKIGPEMAKNGYFGPNFVKPIVYQQYSGICKKQNSPHFF